MRERVLEYVKNNPGCSSSDVDGELGCSNKHAVAILGRAVRSGHLIRTGIARNTRYWPPGTGVAAPPTPGACLITQEWRKGLRLWAEQ